MSRGRFITLEGGDGAGKSTQTRRLVEHLKRRGIAVVMTREVGGAPGAEDIRQLWLSKPEHFWDPLTEAMLIMAARREHLVRTILPAIQKGYWVVSDRFVDSTRAYQGVGLGLGVTKIDTLYKEIAGDFWPDLTLYLDLSVETGLARMKARAGAEDRYEQKQVAFHELLRTAFLGLAKNESKRFRLIDASKDEDRVAASIEQAVSGLIDAANM